MKIAQLTAIKSISINETADRPPNPGEVKIKLAACGICGSDMHLYKTGRVGDNPIKFPFVLGHECSGTIVEITEGVSGLTVGDRVCIEPGIPCGKCLYCKTGNYNLCQSIVFLAAPPYQGCLQEYINYPAEYVFKLPDNMSLEEGALVEPLAVGLNSAETAGTTLGSSVFIYGAGCIGIACLLAAQALGAKKVMIADLIAPRLELAESMGGIPIHIGEQDAEKLALSHTNGIGPDAIINTAINSATVSQSIRVVKVGGTLVSVGCTEDVIDGMNMLNVILRCLTIKSVFRYKNQFQTVIEAVSGGRINTSKLVSHRYTFDETAEAFFQTDNNVVGTTKSMILF